MARPFASDVRRQIVAANLAEYGDSYSLLTFGDPETLHLAERRRETLLATLAEQVETGCRGTKLDMRRLSPGCRLCAEGAWSCLFVNGRCNARCFYCPAPQDETGDPATNSVAFRSPDDYVAYLERFDFRGASFSGGEPLLTFDRTLGYLTAVKRRFGSGMHVWLYTNGLLVTEENLLRLRDAGLDEIRFDIGATGFRLDAVRKAAGRIPTVTVEIPAVPEEVDRMKALMAEMAEIGVDHLNLHQIRLTPHNLTRMAGRPYTFLHGEKVTVLESELTALELIRHGLEAGIELPVNYCSFVYKHRFQRLAARKRSGEVVRKPYESLTAAGYIRTLALAGEAAALERQATRFREARGEDGSWVLGKSRDRLHFHPDLRPLVDFSPFRLLVGYSEAALREAVSYRNPFTEVRLDSGRKLVVERWRTAPEAELSGGQIDRFGEMLSSGEGAGGDPKVLSDLLRFELVPEGLQDYF